MIRRIRKKHKIVWLILAISLPLLFVAGIAFRHAAAVNEKIPVKFTTETQRTQRK
jgi:hypothetical protein